MKCLGPILLFLSDETAQDLIEYALVGALMAMGAVLSLKSVGNTISNAFSHISSTLSSQV